MYKVVFKYSGKYISCSTAALVKDFELEYKPNEWTEAKVGGILVFSGLEAVKGFIKSYVGYEVWRCEVEEEVSLPMWRLDVLYMESHPECVAPLWAGEIDDSWRLADWPPGTRAFKRVRLIERVDGGGHVQGGAQV